MEIDGARLAERVAEAASAWLRDPTDTGIYARLVAAIKAWEAHAHPMLEGTDLLARRPGMAPPLTDDEPAPARQPQPLSALLADVRGRLHPPDPDGPPPDPQEATSPPGPTPTPS